jgi:hypothetical protein
VTPPSSAVRALDPIDRFIDVVRRIESWHEYALF